jgi:hypothetical protein
LILDVFDMESAARRLPPRQGADNIVRKRSDDFANPRRRRSLSTAYGQGTTAPLRRITLNCANWAELPTPPSDAETASTVAFAGTCCARACPVVNMDCMDCSSPVLLV